MALPNKAGPGARRNGREGALARLPCRPHVPPGPGPAGGSDGGNRLVWAASALGIHVPWRGFGYSPTPSARILREWLSGAVFYRRLGEFAAS
jgi:hypothetical protein